MMKYGLYEQAAEIQGTAAQDNNGKNHPAATAE
jgi:hypothetical protein